MSDVSRLSRDFFFFLIDKLAQRRLPVCLCVIAAVVNNKSIEIKRTKTNPMVLLSVFFIFTLQVNKPGGSRHIVQDSYPPKCCF